MKIDLSKPYIRLYHGSLNPVLNPEPNYELARNGDFGKGFYTTSNENQAIKWGYHKLANAEEQNSFFVSEYAFKNTPDLKIKIFDKPDYDWFWTVYDGRQGISLQYDLIIGPVADSRVYNVLNWFDKAKDKIESVLPLDEYREEKKKLVSAAISKLSPDSFRDMNQYVFVTSKGIRKLSFEKWIQYNHEKEPVLVYEKNNSGVFSIRNINQSDQKSLNNTSKLSPRGREL